MKCPFCPTEIKEWDKRTGAHFIATESLEGHIHTHGPMNDREKIEEIIDAVKLEAGIVQVNNTKTLPFKEIIFHNRQRIGDMIMFTCGIRDFKKVYPNIKVNVISTCGHFWDNNPYVDRSITPFYKNGVTLENAKPSDLFSGSTNVLKVGPSRLTNSSNRLDWHFANAFRVSIEDSLGIHIPQGESRGDLWFTKEEYDAPRVEARPYWIIVTGGEKGWGCKMYPTIRWQEVVDQNPDILFYQLGANNDNHVRLQGNNVVDYIGKTEDRNTGIRDLMKLFLNAEGSIGLVSFHMHLSGALGKPCVVVAGAREPVSFTRYAGHQYISNDGCLPCGITACWKCDINACKTLVTVGGELMPKCVDMISSEEVTRNLKRYYDGGRLVYGKVSEKPKVNIGKSNAVIVEEKKSDINTYGLSFNGGALTERDWEFIKKTMKDNNVKSVLEFGGGLSTLLFNDLPIVKTITYEDKQGWIDKLNKLKPNLDIRLWDGKTNGIEGIFDMSFVDGPAGDMSREMSTKIASEKARIVVIHDAGREWAKKYQEKYLHNNFDGPFKGGHRCHLFIRKETPKLTTSKKIGFVFNGRGEGGAERSSTWMMNKLIELGHEVTYYSPNASPCGTFRNVGDKRVRFSNINEANEKLDVLMLYSNDWIWEWGKPEFAEMFGKIKADRKVLCVNFKIDKIGLIPWTQGWDKYLFLSSTHEAILKTRQPNASTLVLPPPTDLTKFFDITPDYSNGLRLIRHSSQGDSKYPKTFNEEVNRLLSTRDDISLRLMPAPSFYDGSNSKVISHKKNTPEISEFLKLGNLFFYHLPLGYTEGGPKVVMEAQASGIPIITDNHSGMKDRVVPGTGWLCNNFEDYLDMVKNITQDDLEERGANARKHARDNYNPMRWIQEILG